MADIIISTEQSRTIKKNVRKYLVMNESKSIIKFEFPLEKSAEQKHLNKKKETFKSQYANESLCRLLYLMAILQVPIKFTRIICQFPLHNIQLQSVFDKLEKKMMPEGGCVGLVARKIRKIVERPLLANQINFLCANVFPGLASSETVARVSNWTHLEYQQNAQKNLFFDL